MDILNTKKILSQIDENVLITYEVIHRINKYVMYLMTIFKNIIVIKKKNDFYKALDIFLYNLELKDNVLKFISDDSKPIVKYDFHKNKEVQKLCCLMSEYLIYDILDMMYSYMSIINEFKLNNKILNNIMNSDSEFRILNHKYKILFLENLEKTSLNKTKQIIKSKTDTKVSKKFLILFRNYLDYIISYYINFNTENCTKNMNSFINTEFIYKNNDQELNVDTIQFHL